MIFDSSGGYMIVVHVNKSWPWVEAERMDEAEAVLGAWPIAEDKLKAYGDVLLAVFNKDNLVRRVTFTGKKSQTWAHLVGQPNPGTHWGRQGDAWPVRYVDTAIVASGDVPVQDTPEGHRAVVDGFTFMVGADLNATVIVPAGRTVTVRAA
jgi:hypothetical protein